MKNFKNFSKPIAFVFIVTLVFACNKEPESTDSKLYNFAKETANYTWYKNSSELLETSEISGHAEPFIRTRYNLEASQHLDSDYKVKDSIVFQEKSIIVKELYESESELSTYAVMYKNSDHEDADQDGWVWGYIQEDGTVKEPAANKGSGCRACHMLDGHIDLTLMNKAFP